MPQFYNDEVFKLDDQSRQLLKNMGDDPAERLSKIEVLRTWVVSHNYLSCRTDDKFLLRFLRIAKFSCEAAKERITKYCVMRSHKLDGAPEWFHNLGVVNDPAVRQVIETGFLYVCPKLDDLGRILMIFEAQRMKGEKIAPVLFVRAMYTIMEFAIHKFERAQVNGVVFLENATKFDTDLLTYWAHPERMKKSMSFMQGGFPIRIKRMEYYNMHAMVKAVLDVAITWMKPKLQERITFYSDHKPPVNIPRDCMPPILDGHAPAWEELKDDFMRELENFQTEFDSLDSMCSVDEGKMPKHYEEGDSWGISGTYRPLAEN